MLASFQAETGWDRPNKRDFFSGSEPCFPDPSLRIPKKISKKFKKLKNTILALFQAETDRDRLKKSENFFLVQNHFFLTQA